MSGPLSVTAKHVAITQSNYIPWKGYFDIIHDVDIFVFYDNVQYTKNDWRNRNKVKGPTGAQWLTVPVGDKLHRLICEVDIKDARWQIKHWKTINQLYGGTPYFRLFRPFLEHFYLERKWTNLSDLNHYLTKTIAQDFLGIRASFLQSSDLPKQGVKQEAVISMLKALNADQYVSGPAGRAYLMPDEFEQEGIQLVWKDYSGYPEYPQIHPPFDHHVTILDLLFHTGNDAQYFIWGWREDKNLAKHAPRERGGK